MRIIKEEVQVSFCDGWCSALQALRHQGGSFILGIPKKNFGQVMIKISCSPVHDLPRESERESLLFLIKLSTSELLHMCLFT